LPAPLSAWFGAADPSSPGRPRENTVSGASPRRIGAGNVRSAGRHRRQRANGEFRCLYGHPIVLIGAQRDATLTRPLPWTSDASMFVLPRLAWISVLHGILNYAVQRLGCAVRVGWRSPRPLGGHQKRQGTTCQLVSAGLSRIGCGAQPAGPHHRSAPQSARFRPSRRRARRRRSDVPVPAATHLSGDQAQQRAGVRRSNFAPAVVLQHDFASATATIGVDTRYSRRRPRQG